MMDEELDKFLKPRPWWCPVCGAGDGGVDSDFPPVDHVCVDDPTRGNPQGLEFVETRLERFVDWMSYNKAEAVVIGLCFFTVMYLIFQILRAAMT